jgi:hypothetical protein
MTIPTIVDFETKLPVCGPVSDPVSAVNLAEIVSGPHIGCVSRRTLEQVSADAETLVAARRLVEASGTAWCD